MTDDELTIAPLAPGERQALLASRVSNLVANGYRVESQAAFHTVLVRGRRPNHLLHLVLTVLTLGLWSIMWVLVAIIGGEKRRVLTVDEYGNVAMR